MKLSDFDIDIHDDIDEQNSSKSHIMAPCRRVPVATPYLIYNFKCWKLSLAFQ